ncbi:restriction endonuclease fold toxin-2 domain-containing protein [Streptomyces sioyaensis]|uniref:restriction endonuclease fold toxin-2 domain-containing protein n=1 Tax=Streptomyces sioyaensis TaxID=67364 RepID=UPI003405C027
MSGFHVDPPKMLVSSAGFTDLQSWASQIHRGLVGSLDDVAGMAGDDGTGHSFAAKYDPAAQAFVDALGKGVAQLGGMANGLYTMALNYIRTDADVAAKFMKPQQLPASSNPQCDEEHRKFKIPTAVGQANWVVREIIARFWPQGDPEKLREAAKNWRHVGQLVSRLGTEGDKLIRTVTASSEAQAVDSCAANWRKMHNGGGTGPLLNTLSTSAQSLASACDAYAQGIEDLRDTLEDLAMAAGGVAVAGVALTVLTVGISDVAAAGGEAAIAAEAGIAAAALTAEVEASAELAVLAEAASVIDAAAADLIPIASATSAPLAAAGPRLTLAAATGVTPGLPPLPPDPHSRYPHLSPHDQAQFRQWMAQMAADGRTSTAVDPANVKGDKAARREYQIRVAGSTEYSLYTTEVYTEGKNKGQQRSMNADGVRPQDGAVIDAKYVAQRPSCRSPLRLNNVDNVPDFVYKNVADAQEDELGRYTSAIHDPRNKVNHLEVVTNDEKAGAYFDAMMAAKNTPGETRIVK